MKNDPYFWWALLGAVLIFAVIVYDSLVNPWF